MSGFPAHFPIAMHEKLVALQAAVSSIERRLEAHPSQQATHDCHAASQIDDELNCDPIKLHLTGGGATRWHFLYVFKKIFFSFPQYPVEMSVLVNWGSIYSHKTTYDNLYKSFVYV